MAWRDTLRGASVNGVKFDVDASDTLIGRRTVLHQYPMRDIPFTEDLGRLAEQYTFPAFVVGDDYMTRRDALMRELTKGGTVKLVHPYLGTKTVNVVTARVLETAREGRMARFLLTFIEAGEQREPLATRDTTSLVGSFADKVIEAAENAFGDKFDVSNVAGFVLDSAIQNVQDAVAISRTANGAIAGATQPITDFANEADNLNNEIVSLIQQPKALATRVTRLIASAVNVGVDAVNAIEAYGKMDDFGAAINPIQRITPSRIQEADNQEALVNLVRQSAAIEKARTLSTVQFESYDQAIILRDKIIAQIDKQIETPYTSNTVNPIIDDDVYIQLADLRASVFEDVKTRSASLARIYTYTPPITLPALLIAYQQYGDASRETDIIARNKIRHPGFVRGGQPLELLSK